MKKSIYKMDKYEMELEKMAEAGEFVEVKNSGKVRMELRQVALRYFKSKSKLASSS